MADRIIFKVELRITDRDALAEHAFQVLGLDAESSLEDRVADVVCNPAKEPSEHGYEIVSKSVSIQGVNTVLEVTFDVTDSDAVVAEAIACYASLWRDETWRPMNLEEALFEITVSSNDDPSPVDIGFEIDRFLSITETGVPSHQAGNAIAP